MSGLDENLKKIIESRTNKDKQDNEKIEHIEHIDDVDNVDDVDDVDDSDDSDGKKEYREKLKELLSDKGTYLKKAIEGEDPELSLRVVDSMDKWDKPKHKDEKFTNKERLAQSYWTLYREVLTRVNDKSIQKEKKQMINYGLIREEYITEDQKNIIKTIDEENRKASTETIFLAFDWFKNIVEGKIPPSTTDETSVSRKGVSKEKLEGKKGQLDAELKSARLKIDKLEDYEYEIKRCSEIIIDHDVQPDLEKYDLRSLYEHDQRDAIATILDAAKNILKIDRQLATNYRVIDKMTFEVDKMESALESGENYAEVSEIVYTEYVSFKQMAKMCAGRQGNHFPILYSGYMPQDTLNIGTVENIKKTIDAIEQLDPNLFYRTYKGEDHKIVPYFVVMPSYGDYGICWEPFSRSNRATSRGRIVIPMFPKNLKIALLTGLADLRWQVAKEKAQHYWMEEGLTGEYYKYYMDQKLKGNVKSYFINDYIKWINWESRGVQKLHKEARPVFWRYTPFPSEVREDLKNKGYYYTELYKKDQTRLKSDGY